MKTKEQFLLECEANGINDITKHPKYYNYKWEEEVIKE